MNWKVVNPYFGESEGFSSYPDQPGNYAIYTCPSGYLKFDDDKLPFFYPKLKYLEFVLGWSF
jgi:hypothetical protein